MEKPYWLPGSSLTLDGLNKLSSYIDWAGRLRVDPASGLKLIDVAGNRSLRMDRPRDIWGTLAGSGGPYTFTQALDGASASWSSYPRTGNAWEVNGIGGLTGKVARLIPDGKDYRFQWVVNPPPPGYCGCSGIPATLFASLTPLVATFGAPSTCTLPFLNPFTGYFSACLPCTGGTIRAATRSCRITFSCIGTHTFILNYQCYDSTNCGGGSTNSGASTSVVASPCGATLAWTAPGAFGTGLTGNFGVTS